MKKKILLALLLTLIAMCFFALSVSAETPSMYIEFGARFPGNDEYITVYTQNAESAGNPQINFASYKFYSDVEFTQEVDMSTATGIDFSVAKSYVDGVQGNAPTRMKKPSSPFVNCVEVKWFLEGFPTVSYEGQFFKGWTGLKSFDFGNATAIQDNTFEGCGLESITIPASITSIGGSAFKDCLSLKSVKIEGVIKKYNNGSTFFGCTALESVDFCSNTDIGVNMFYNCTSLKTLENFTNIISIGNQAFCGCTQLSEVSFGKVTYIGTSSFKQSGIASVIIPKEVTSVGNEAFANCKSLTSIVFEEGFSGTLGSSAFMGTSSVTTLTLVEGITSIPSQCFWNCGSTNGIENVTLPDTVKTLAGRAFNGSGIVALEIRETSQLQSITGDAFAGMKKMKSIYLPTGVVISCDNLFQYCHKLERVDNFENVKLNISSYGENVFVGKIFYECMALKEIKIPHSVTKIVGTAWRYFAVERIYIPSSVTSINKGWLDDLTHMPSAAVIIYCGGDAQKLLSLTNDGEGNVSTRLSSIIENGNVIVYSGIDAEYENGSIVIYANACDVYYGGVHADGGKTLYTYIDDEGKPNGVKFLSTLKISIPCGRECGEETVLHTIPALFENLGYSVDESGDGGLVMGFKVNKDAVMAYKEATGISIEYGVFAGGESKLGNSALFDSNGETVQGVFSSKILNHEFSYFDLKLVGFVTDELKDKKLAFGAYVVESNGEVTYLQNEQPQGEEKYYYTTYNALINK